MRPIASNETDLRARGDIEREFTLAERCASHGTLLVANRREARQASPADLNLRGDVPERLNRRPVQKCQAEFLDESAMPVAPIKMIEAGGRGIGRVGGWRSASEMGEHEVAERARIQALDRSALGAQGSECGD